MKNMLLTLIVLLLSNAVISNKDKSILFSDNTTLVVKKLSLYLRTSILCMCFNILLLVNGFYASPLITGIGIYDEFFNITITTHATNIFIYFISAVIMVIVVFFNRNIKKITYILFLNAIVSVNFKLLSLIIIKEFDFLFLATVLTSVSAVLIVAVMFGLKGETRSSTFYFSIFTITYVINLFLMWVQSMFSDIIDPLHIYPLLFVLGVDRKSMLNNVSCVSHLNHVPWDDHPQMQVIKAVKGNINPGGPPVTGIKGTMSILLDSRYYRRHANFDGRGVLVAYNKARIERYFVNSSVYPWRLSGLDTLPQGQIPITWPWGVKANAIVFPHNPRLDYITSVYNLLKDDEVARKEYFILKEQAMIKYSHLNMAETQTNLWLLNKQKDRFHNNGKYKL